MSGQVLEAFSEDGQTDDEYQRSDGRDRIDRRDLWEALDDGHEEEVDVRIALELAHQRERQERECRVPGGADVVGLVEASVDGRVSRVELSGLFRRGVFDDGRFRFGRFGFGRLGYFRHSNRL